VCPLAQASLTGLIAYDLTSLGADRYRYDYTVTNDGSLGAGVPLEWFQLQFDPLQYQESTLGIVSDPGLAADWDQLLLGSGVGLPASYDVFALTGGRSLALPSNSPGEGPWVCRAPSPLRSWTP
jgi:hypothetical protein